MKSEIQGFGFVGIGSRGTQSGNSEVGLRDTTKVDYKRRRQRPPVCGNEQRREDPRRQNFSPRTKVV